MVDGTGHGQQYAQRLTLGAGPALFAQTLKQSQIAVTQVKCDRPTLQLSGTSMLKDAYQVGLQFRDFPVFETWIDGKALPVTAQACCGTVSNGRRISCAPGLSLSDVAGACGFADQSHFTRVFSRIAGISPGAWRRLQVA